MLTFAMMAEKLLRHSENGMEEPLPAAGIRVDAETGEIAIPRAALGSGACLRVVVPPDGGN